MEIEKFINKYGQVKISKNFEIKAKERIITNIKLEKIGFFGKIFGKKVFPSTYLKRDVKERILNFLRKKEETLYQQFFDFGRKIISSTVLASIFFVFVFWTGGGASADIKSTIVVQTGSAKIKSIGEGWKNLDKTHILSIGDKIKTTKNSTVEIYFYDNSTARISENTEFSIQNLTTNLLEKKPTIINLSKGRIWSQVFDSDFKIQTKDILLETKQGSFDIKKGKNSEIKSVSSSINLKSKNNGKSTLGAGFGVKVKNGKITKNIFKSDVYISKNKNKDRRYRNNLIKKIAQNIISKKDYKKEKITFVQKDIEKIKILIVNGKNIRDFNTKKIEKSVRELKKAKKDSIFTFLNNENNLMKIIIPGDEMYGYKIFISKLLQKNFKEFFVKNKMANQSLYEAHEIISGKKDISKILMAINHFGKIRDKSGYYGSEKIAKTKLFQKSEQLVLIQSIENNIFDLGIKRKLIQEKIRLGREMSKMKSFIKKKENDRSENYQVGKIIEKIDKFKGRHSRKNTLYFILEDIGNDKKNLNLVKKLQNNFQDMNLKILTNRKILKIKNQAL